jgi:hypothetical protein
MVGLTEFITHEDDNIAEIPKAFGELMKDVE